MKYYKLAQKCVTCTQKEPTQSWEQLYSSSTVERELPTFVLQYSTVTYVSTCIRNADSEWMGTDCTGLQYHAMNLYLKVALPVKLAWDLERKATARVLHITKEEKVEKKPLHLSHDAPVEPLVYLR